MLFFDSKGFLNHKSNGNWKKILIELPLQEVSLLDIQLSYFHSIQQWMMQIQLFWYLGWNDLKMSSVGQGLKIVLDSSLYWPKLIS